jgi:hypothetical protein
MEKDYFVPKILIVILCMLGIGGYLDKDAQKVDDSEYCEMVKLHISNVNLGWPDYNGNYNKLCKVNPAK